MQGEWWNWGCHPGMEKNMDISDPSPISPLLSPTGSFWKLPLPTHLQVSHLCPVGSRPPVLALLSLGSPLIFPSVLPALRGPLWRQFKVILSTHLPRIIPSSERPRPFLSRPPCLPMLTGSHLPPQTPPLLSYSPTASVSFTFPDLFRLSSLRFTCSPTGHP